MTTISQMEEFLWLVQALRRNNKTIAFWEISHCFLWLMVTKYNSLNARSHGVCQDGNEHTVSETIVFSHHEPEERNRCLKIMAFYCYYFFTVTAQDNLFPTHTKIVEHFKY